jgi:flagellar protein FliS
MLKNAADKYQVQKIMTASPARLVAMLYDKAISCLNDAIRAIETGDVEARWKANTRAIEIVNHLLTTLDMEKGGDISKNLDQLYRFILARLPEVDMKNNSALAREVIGLLDPLRKAWTVVADRGGGKAPVVINAAQRPDASIAISA